MNVQRRIIESDIPLSDRSLRGRLASGEPNPVDVHVGRRLRQKRMLSGLSQEQLAEAIGITFQQIQKYEHGTNRIGASRLWDLSLVLDCPISFFFHEMPEDVARSSPRNLSRATSCDTFETELPSLAPDDVFTNRETLGLLRAYSAIREVTVRRRIVDLTKSLATAEGETSER
jgi:transcriptional regulator with XRE-family HTH domain